MPAGSYPLKKTLPSFGPAQFSFAEKVRFQALHFYASRFYYGTDQLLRTYSPLTAPATYFPAVCRMNNIFFPEVIHNCKIAYPGQAQKAIRHERPALYEASRSGNASVFTQYVDLSPHSFSNLRLTNNVFIKNNFHPPEG